MPIDNSFLQEGKVIMLKLLGLLAFSAFFVSTAVEADSGASGHINIIQSYTGHSGILISLDTSYQKTEGCVGSMWYILPDNSPRNAFVQAMLLTAQANHQIVDLALSGCFENYAKIQHVTLKGEQKAASNFVR